MPEPTRCPDGLSSEQREEWQAAIDFHRGRATEGHKPNAQIAVILAVADHLTAVEGLLKRVDDHLKVNGYSQGMPWRPDVVALRGEIAILLGGTANVAHK